MSMSSVPCNSSIRFLYWSFSLIEVDTLLPMEVDCLLRFCRGHRATLPNLLRRSLFSLTIYISFRIGRVSRRQTHGTSRKGRPASRDSRPAHSQSRGVGSCSRLRNFPADSPDLRRGSASPAGLALSGASSAGKAWLACSRLGRIGERPAGQVLPFID